MYWIGGDAWEGGSHHTKQWDTHLHKICIIIVSVGALDAYLIALCPGGRAMCLYLNRAREKCNLCRHKALVGTYFHEDVGRYTDLRELQN